MSNESLQTTVMLKPWAVVDLVPPIDSESESESMLHPEFIGTLQNDAIGDDHYANRAHLTFYPLADILKLRNRNFQLSFHMSLEVEFNYPDSISDTIITWDFSACMDRPKVVSRATLTTAVTQIYHCVATGVFDVLRRARPSFSVSLEWRNHGISSKLGFKNKVQIYSFGVSGYSQEKFWHFPENKAQVKLKVHESTINPQISRYLLSN